MVVVMFRTELRPEAKDVEYAATARRMRELVAQVPGFISAKTYTAADGERLTIVRFESEAALEAWRTLPEHVAVQQRGREFFYQSYWVQVCTTVREYEFRRDEG